MHWGTPGWPCGRRALTLIAGPGPGPSSTFVGVGTRSILILGSIFVAGACGDAADVVCTDQRAIFRLSPAPPDAPNEFQRTLCAEVEMERDGCPIMQFSLSSEDDDGFVRIATANADGSCPALFEAELVEASQRFRMQGSQVVMSRSGILFAEAGYESSNGSDGQVNVVIEPELFP